MNNIKLHKHLKLEINANEFKIFTKFSTFVNFQYKDGKYELYFDGYIFEPQRHSAKYFTERLVIKIMRLV